MLKNTPRLRRYLSVAACLAAAALLQGCLLLDDQLNRLPSLNCSFDIEEAYRCEDHRALYRVRGACKGHPYFNGIYMFEGELKWTSEDGAIKEWYKVEPWAFPPHDFSAGEIYFKATCDGDPYVAGSSANCSNASYTTTMNGIPAGIWKLVQEAKPIAIGQFSAAELAQFPVEQDCVPPPPQRPRHRPVFTPGCEVERAPALLITSPQRNQVFEPPIADSLTLAFERLRPETELVEVEWQKIEGRPAAFDGLPTLVAWSNFPLSIALTEDPSGALAGFYRVKVRPHDEDCPRLWSFWQEFETQKGGPVVAASRRVGR